MSYFDCVAGDVAGAGAGDVAGAVALYLLPPHAFF